MKVYQLKAAIKNIKPPAWKRCLIPAGITFAQLGIILEELMETDVTEAYEFEFYQRKIHVREWRENGNISRYMFDFMSASDTYIDTLLHEGEWFTFRTQSEREYRVTIEKCMENIEFSYPVIVKQKENASVCTWAETAEKNKELQRVFSIQYGDPDYRTFQELRKDLEKGVTGLRGNHKAVSRDIRNKKSPDTMLQEMAEQLIKPYIERAMSQMSQKMENKENGEFVYNPQVGLEILESIETDMRRELPQKLFGRTSAKAESRNPMVVGYLMAYGKDDLIEIAEELHLRHKGLKKAELAEKIKNEILTPAVMKRRMLLLSDEEIEAFEEIIREGICYRAKEQNLEALYNLDYIAWYEDGYVEVPREVSAVYEKINTQEYQRMRRQVVWMYACLQMVGLFYASAPVRIIYRLYRKREGYKVSMEEFLEVFQQVPEEENPCVIQDGKMIYKRLLRDNLYLNIEQYQKGKDFYIPTVDEVWDYLQNGYPSKDVHYQKLGEFFKKELGMEPDYSSSLLSHMWKEISMGAGFSDVMDLVNEEGIVFPTERAVEQFAGIMMDVNNHTRMLDNRGHTPLEISSRSSVHNDGKMPTIVPVSTLAANMLKEAQPELDARGIPVDYEETAQEIPAVFLPNGSSGEAVMAGKKIYPNDPCPCGSGKKYKKCCGRNRQ